MDETSDEGRLLELIIALNVVKFENITDEEGSKITEKDGKDYRLFAERIKQGKTISSDGREKVILKIRKIIRNKKTIDWIYNDTVRYIRPYDESRKIYQK